MKTWLQLKDVNLSLEASNSQYNLTYFFSHLTFISCTGFGKEKGKPCCYSATNKKQILGGNYI